MEAAFKLEWAEKISEIKLIESDGGAFEIRVDGDLIYSKLETGRHPEPPEILELFRKHIKE